jgi:hypothetical protein
VGVFWRRDSKPNHRAVVWCLCQLSYPGSLKLDVCLKKSVYNVTATSTCSAILKCVDICVLTKKAEALSGVSQQGTKSCCINGVGLRESEGRRNE